jgi:hypothetical protein
VSGWESFRSILWSASWVANTGVPLLITLVSLITAYVLFRRQVAHDRKIFAEQLTADRQLAVDQGRRQFAARYAAEARANASAIHAAGRTFSHDPTDGNYARFFQALLNTNNDATQSVATLTGTIGHGAATRTASAIVETHLARLIDVEENDLPIVTTDDEAGKRTTLRTRFQMAGLLAHTTGQQLEMHANQLETWDGSEPQPGPGSTLAELQIPPEAIDAGTRPLTPSNFTDYHEASERWHEQAVLPVHQLLERLRAKDEQRARLAAERE